MALTLILTILTVVFCSSALQQALHASMAVCSAGRHLQAYRWGWWCEIWVVPNLDTPGHHPVSQHRTPVLFPYFVVWGIMGSFGRLFSSRKAAVGLWLEGACTTWALLHRVCMLTLSPEFRRHPPFSLTATAPALDTVSSPGAGVVQLLSALETSQIQTLTASACGERLSPDAALTPLPSCMLFTFRCWHLLNERKD